MQPTRRSGPSRVLRSSAALLSTAGLFAACGSDGEPGPGAASATTAGGSPRDAQVDAVVEWTVGDASDAGIDIDRDCVREVVVELGDEDLALLAEAAAADDEDAVDPELSDDGEALGQQLVECYGTATDTTPAGAELVDEAVQAALATGDGALLDEACLRDGFASLPAGVLEAVIGAGADADSDDPRLLLAFDVFVECFGGGAAAEPVAPDLDLCSLLDPATLATAFQGLDDGETGASVGVYGPGRRCEWSNADGEHVSVTVTDAVDLAAWRAESTNGDGVGDGTVVDGVGDEAYASGGGIGFAVGERLFEVRCFPSFDATPELLTSLASTVLGNL